MVTQKLKNLPAIQETCVQSLGQEDPLEKGMTAYSSILAWRIPWTEEPGGLQSKGSQRVGHDRSNFHRNSTGNRNYITVAATYSVSSFLSVMFSIYLAFYLHNISFIRLWLAKCIFHPKLAKLFHVLLGFFLALKEIFNSLIPLKILST